MAKFRLLLLDACVIIYLFEIGQWEHIIESCDVHLSEKIIEEADFYIDPAGQMRPIDLSPYRSRITVHSVAASRLAAHRSGLGGSILDRMDDGEAELLCVLRDELEPHSVCSGDSVVYQYLGAVQCSAQGVSLEKILQQTGRSAAELAWQFTEAFREKNARQGFEEGQTGRALQ